MFATTLRCFRCGGESSFDTDAYCCPSCGPGGAGADPGVLDVVYDYEAAGRALRSALETPRKGSVGVFRYLPLLPLARPASVLATGGTPLVPAPRLARRLGLAELYLKDETRNPTRCLKDRATAVGVSLALDRGATSMLCASAGNAAISLAGFCAHQGMESHAFVPAEASPVRLDWLRRFGATIHRSEGNYDQAFEESEQAWRENGWYSRNCALNPFLVEGKKTASFEIAEQLGWRVPDLVAAPVGDGCTLGAIGKGFRELREMGFTDEAPRLVGTQASAVQPMVERFSGREGSGAEEEGTKAASIAVREPRNALRLLQELRESRGTLLAVPDADTQEAQRLLAVEAGIVAEFTSATPLAGLLRLSREEDLSGKRAVLVVTGGRVD